MASSPADPELADVDEVTFTQMEQDSGDPMYCPDWRTEHLSSRDHRWLGPRVHPAFDRDKFLFDGFNFEEIDLACRFASRLLYADCLIPFWYTLLVGNLYYDPDLAGRQNKAANLRTYTREEQMVATQEEIHSASQNILNARCEPARRHTLLFRNPYYHEDDVWGRGSPEAYALNAAQIGQTRAHLTLVTNWIRFRVHPSAKASGMECNTAWVFPTEGSSPGSRPYPGSPSIINIDPQVLSRHSTSMNGDLICQATASVMLGINLVKQFAHAAMAVTRSGAECNWSSQYLFQNDYMPGREGRMLEGCSFGGVFRSEQEQTSTSFYTIDGAEGVPGLWFVYSDWAGALLTEMFGFHRDEYGDPPDWGPWHHREWKVPFSWFLHVLTDRLWDADLRERGQVALVPPMELGYVMARNGEGKHGPYPHGYIDKDFLPLGYNILPRSYIIAKDELFNEARRAIMFGESSFWRMPPNASLSLEDQRPDSGESDDSDDASSEESSAGEPMDEDEDEP